jgi:drug/metabolite transporter (DMT)-like permease
MLLAFAAVYFIWGSTFLGIAFAVESIPPFLMVGSRFAVAGLSLYALLRLRGKAVPSMRQVVNASLIGVTTLGLGTSLVAWAEQHIASGLAALIVSAVPLWLVLLDWKMLKGGAPTRPVVGGLVLGFVGIIVLVGPDVLSGVTSSNSLSVMAVFVATIAWSVGSLRSKMIEMPNNLFMSSAIQMAGGGLGVVVVGIALGELNGFEFSAMTAKSMWGWGYLVVFGSWGAFSAYVWLLAHAPPKQLASYAFVNPVVAVFLGWWLADEVIDTRIIVAVVIMVTAVALIVIYGGKSQKNGSSASSSS